MPERVRIKIKPVSWFPVGQKPMPDSEDDEHPQSDRSYQAIGNISPFQRHEPAQKNQQNIGPEREKFELMPENAKGNAALRMLQRVPHE